VVNLEFNSQGAADFEEATGVLATRTSPMNSFAIVLDGQVISYPSVSNAIAGGRAEISGNFTQKTATELANVLKYGALPLAFEISSVDTVSPTLGSDQLQAGIIAGIIGLVLVTVFAFVYYRGLTVVVVASLALAAAQTWALMVLLGHSVGFALNLPGVAGAIVAIGVTADSFIIYFERIRDEVREGRPLRSAIETGWVKSRNTILVADGVSLLSAVVLFFLAIGGVKGFAFVLGLTTILDIMIVFFFTKPLVSLLGRTKFYGGGHPWSGFGAEHMGVSLDSLLGRRRNGGRRKAVAK
jgi:preprotein translocase subunit SecD